MRLVKVENLKEYDVLAKDVLTADYNVLLGEGTKICNDYIEKLKKYRVREVYITEEDDIEEVTILRENVQNEIHDLLQNVMEKHTYSNSGELSELCQAADKVISNILEEKDVVEKLYDIKQRSADVYEHSISVCSIATLIALKRKLDSETVHDIGVACLLHELGLRYISISYENREICDMDELDAVEYKKHPVYAYTALQDEKWLSESCKQMILYHHERLDGSGYPLKATEIPEACRIIQICDVFDEFMCGIGCERVKVYEALEYLKIYKGTKFDKMIVEDFMSLIAVYPVGSYVKTSEGEVGVVLRQNREFPDRPVIRIIKEKDGSPVKKIIIKDLMKITTLFIEDID